MEPNILIQAEKIKELIDKENKNNKTGKRRYSKKIKYTLALLLADGVSPRELSEIIGIRDSLLSIWKRKYLNEAQKSDGFKKVSITTLV